MNFMALEALRAFVEGGSIAEASLRIHRSPSQVSRLLAMLEDRDPVIVKNIFRSVENVNLATVIAFKKDGVKHNFLDEY